MAEDEAQVAVGAVGGDLEFTSLLLGKGGLAWTSIYKVGGFHLAGMRRRKGGGKRKWENQEERSKVEDSKKTHCRMRQTICFLRRHFLFVAWRGKSKLSLNQIGVVCACPSVARTSPVVK